jgi:Na+-translocating ferredoxin:NAD+ oxidoreductase RnfD subunit
MIQRIQSIWLLLASAAAFATLKLSFYSGNKDNNLFEELTGSSHFLLMVLSVAVGLLALITIFLYKNRKLQIRLSLLGVVLQLAVLAVYFQQIKTYVQGNFTLTSAVSFIIPVFFILAWLGIRKDEKLIKSMDRLR